MSQVLYLLADIAQRVTHAWGGTKGERFETKSITILVEYH